MNVTGDAGYDGPKGYPGPIGRKGPDGYSGIRPHRSVFFSIVETFSLFALRKLYLLRKVLSMNTKKQINYYGRTTGFVSAGKNNRGMKIIKVLHILLVKAKLDRY